MARVITCDHHQCESACTELRSKIIFDMHPTNPRVDIKPTGCSEFWLHDVDLVKYKVKQYPDQTSLDTESHSLHPRAPPPFIILEIYKSRIACTHKVVGLITPSRFLILCKAFYRTKLGGLHEAIILAPTGFASELQGLLARKTMLENKLVSKQIKDSFCGPCQPTSILPS
eukprot:46545-Pelagomonas_calceolata.AAC.7